VVHHGNRDGLEDSLPEETNQQWMGSGPSKNGMDVSMQKLDKIVSYQEVE
jgi:hypothetical protein